MRVLKMGTIFNTKVSKMMSKYDPEGIPKSNQKSISNGNLGFWRHSCQSFPFTPPILGPDQHRGAKMYAKRISKRLEMLMSLHFSRFLPAPPLPHGPSTSHNSPHKSQATATHTMQRYCTLPCVYVIRLSCSWLKGVGLVPSPLRKPL